MVPDHPQADGAGLSQQAHHFWQNDWQGKTVMAVGMQDPVLGWDSMQALRLVIRNCPEPLQLPDAGHFVQEQGESIARYAVAAFKDL
jgi:tRNA(adenine34) deaminase